MIKDFKSFMNKMFNNEQENLEHPLVKQMDAIINTIYENKDHDSLILNYIDYNDEPPTEADEIRNKLAADTIKSLIEPKFQEDFLAGFDKLADTYVEQTEKYFRKEERFFTEECLNRCLSPNDNDTILVKAYIIKQQEKIKSLIDKNNVMKDFLNKFESQLLENAIMKDKEYFPALTKSIQKQKNILIDNVTSLADSYLVLAGLNIYTDRLLHNLSDKKQDITFNSSDISKITDKVQNLRASFQVKEKTSNNSMNHLT